MQKGIRLPNHKLAVARRFNRSANTYHEACILERELGNRLLERLDFIKQEPITILDLGGATGIEADKLSRRYPKATVFNLDLAENLLQQTNHHKNIINICGDGECLPFRSHTIDFIFSNCVLHWCYNLPKLLQEIHRVLRPEGLFLFSTLGPDTLKELRESFYQIDTDLHVNNFMDMHLIGDALLQTLFSDPVMDTEWLTFTYPTVSLLIEDIRKGGSSYVFREQIPGLSPKSLYQNLCKNYEQFRGDSIQLPATIEIIYGHAWGNANKTSDHCQSSQKEDLYYIPISKIQRS